MGKIQHYSRLITAETEEQYTSARAYLKRAPYLCRSASFQEFKEEMQKWMQGLNVPLNFLLAGMDEENGDTFFFTYCLYSPDGDKKLDWILSTIPKDMVLDTLEIENPNTGLTTRDVVEDFPKLREVYERHGVVVTDLKGFGLKQSSFEWNNFSVVNAGFPFEKMQNTLNSLTPAIEKMRKVGFGDILYGPLIFVSSPLKGQVYNTYQKQYKDVDAGAYYSVPQDHIVVKSSLQDKKNYAFMLAHELGHRHYYKFLSPSQRQRWEAHFMNRGLYVQKKDVEALKSIFLACTPDMVDPLTQVVYKNWSLTNWQKVTVRLNQNLAVKELLDFICIFDQKSRNRPEKNIKTLRREWFQNLIGEESLWGTAWFAKHFESFARALATKTLNENAVRFSRRISPTEEEWLRAVEKWGEEPFANIQIAYEHCLEYMPKWSEELDKVVGLVLQIPYSSSEYGANNPSEDYAEAFQFYINNLEMPTDILREFISINNIRVASKKKAKISPEEKMRIDALRKKIDKFYKEKNFEEAEELEAVLESLLEETEAREVYLEHENDDGEDLYGVPVENAMADVDLEGAGYSLENQLASLYMDWAINPYPRRDFEDTNAVKEYTYAQVGEPPPAVIDSSGRAFLDPQGLSKEWHEKAIRLKIPDELAKSKKMFLIAFADVMSSGDWWSDLPKKPGEYSFEEALEVCKDAYEAILARRNKVKGKPSWKSDNLQTFLRKLKVTPQTSDSGKGA